MGTVVRALPDYVYNGASRRITPKRSFLMRESMIEPMQTPKIVDKPWGREIWYAHTANYAGKVLEVKAGQRLSLQKHEVKEETLYLLSGRVKLTYGEHSYDWE